MCRSGMEHFIMSVKHSERCTKLADTERERKGAERQSHEVTVYNHQPSRFRRMCVCV